MEGSYTTLNSMIRIYGNALSFFSEQSDKRIHSDAFDNNLIFFYFSDFKSNCIDNIIQTECLLLFIYLLINLFIYIFIYWYIFYSFIYLPYTFGVCFPREFIILSFFLCCVVKVNI